MVAWYLDSGLSVLRNQLKTLHTNIVIGTIGDVKHSSETSDHNPDPDGSVDAIDPMYQNGYTMAMATPEIDAIVASRDSRVKYIISNRRIISSTVDPWKWRAYDGTDPHTNHWHLSVNDSHHDNLNPWKLSEALMEHSPYLPLDDYSVPELHKGDDDDKFSGYRVVSRAQLLINYQLKNDITVDGVYGNDTVEAVKDVFGGDGKKITVANWAVLMGLSKR